jgi:hypothetical protein
MWFFIYVYKKKNNKNQFSAPSEELGSEKKSLLIKSGDDNEAT